MPFTEHEDREKMDKILAMQKDLVQMAGEVAPGDLCYAQYKKLMRAWEKSPRWTTVDYLATPLFPDNEIRAYFLAFLVFFAFKAIPYERTKQRENGDVTGED